jgi:hypothetical protein
MGYLLYAAGIVQVSSGSTGAVSASGEADLGPAGSTHEHAQFAVTVNGKQIDFSQSQYQLQSNYVHFEAGKGQRIHKHATGATIGYALDTLGMGINETCIQTRSDTYCESDGGELSVTVNGEEIGKPGSHVIQDGEVIRIDYT